MACHVFLFKITTTPTTFIAQYDVLSDLAETFSINIEFEAESFLAASREAKRRLALFTEQFAAAAPLAG